MKQNRFWNKVTQVMILRRLLESGQLQDLSLSKVAKKIGLSGSNPARQVQLYLRDINNLRDAERSAGVFVEGLEKENNDGLQ